MQRMISRQQIMEFATGYRFDRRARWMRRNIVSLRCQGLESWVKNRWVAAFGVALLLVGSSACDDAEPATVAEQQSGLEFGGGRWNGWPAEARAAFASMRSATQRVSPADETPAERVGALFDDARSIAADLAGRSPWRCLPESVCAVAGGALGSQKPCPPGLVECLAPEDLRGGMASAGDDVTIRYLGDGWWVIMARGGPITVIGPAGSWTWWPDGERTAPSSQEQAIMPRETTPEPDEEPAPSADIIIIQNPWDDDDDGPEPDDAPAGALDASGESWAHLAEGYNDCVSRAAFWTSDGHGLPLIRDLSGMLGDCAADVLTQAPECGARGHCVPQALARLVGAYRVPGACGSAGRTACYALPGGAPEVAP